MPSKTRRAQRVTVTISLGNAEMLTWDHVGRALKDLGGRLVGDNGEPRVPDFTTISDANGQIVGQLTTSHHYYDATNL
jgi:hypothetical protein